MSNPHKCQVRKPAVAGMFYSDNISHLIKSVDGYLEPHPLKNKTKPRILIVPHAGFIYSGLAAGAAYKHIVNFADHIKNVAILGPSHHKYLETIAYPTDGQFETPLGSIAVNHQMLAELAKTHELLKPNSLAHLKEHCLEVQLPFLQRVLSDIQIIPLLMGKIAENDISALIASILEYDNTLVVISTDLSHYLSYGDSVRQDNETAKKIEMLQLSGKEENIACGIFPLIGALKYARDANLKIERLSLMNSGDTAGPRDQVVGYGAWMIYDPFEGNI